MCGPLWPVSRRCARKAIVCTVLPKPCNTNEGMSGGQRLPEGATHHLISKDAIEILAEHERQPIQANQLIWSQVHAGTMRKNAVLN